MKSVLIGILIGAIICGVVYFTILDKPIPEPEIKTVVDTVYTKVIERDTIWEIMQPDIVFDTVFVEIATPSIETDVWEDSELVFEEEWYFADTTIVMNNGYIDIGVVFSDFWKDFEFEIDYEVTSDSVFIIKNHYLTKPTKFIVPVVSVGGIYDDGLSGMTLGGGFRIKNKLDLIISGTTDKQFIGQLNWKF